MSTLLTTTDVLPPRRRLGRKPYPVTLRNLNVFVTADQREAVEQLADEKRISLSEAAREILARAIGVK
jgi:hypothetical protein